MSHLEEYRCFLPGEVLPLFPLLQEEGRKTRSRNCRNPSAMRTRPRRQWSAIPLRSRFFARLCLFRVRCRSVIALFFRQTNETPTPKNKRKEYEKQYASIFMRRV